MVKTKWWLRDPWTNRATFFTVLLWSALLALPVLQPGHSRGVLFDEPDCVVFSWVILLVFCFFAILPAAVLAAITILVDKLRSVDSASLTYQIGLALPIGIVIGLILGFYAGMHGNTVP